MLSNEQINKVSLLFPGLLVFFYVPPVLWRSDYWQINHKTVVAVPIETYFNKYIIILLLQRMLGVRVNVDQKNSLVLFLG